MPHGTPRNGSMGFYEHLMSASRFNGRALDEVCLDSYKIRSGGFDSEIPNRFVPLSLNLRTHQHQHRSTGKQLHSIQLQRETTQTCQLWPWVIPAQAPWDQRLDKIRSLEFGNLRTSPIHQSTMLKHAKHLPPSTTAMSSFFGL